MKVITIVILFLTMNLSANEKKDVVNFDNIRQVLKNDGLLQIENEKKESEQKQVTESESKTKKYYNFPAEEDFWSFFSEYWLVKNATVLKWDFRKPDYGVVKAFTILLETLGLYEKKIKVLYINTPNVTHYALPSNANEYIFVVSLPFIRTMDLSKLEISLMLLEDLLRVDEKLFLQNIDYTEIKNMFGKNFHGKTLDPKLLDDLLKKFDLQIYDKGFTFKQQFSITKKMDGLLKSDQKLWNSYFRLLKKIDELVKTNVMYQKHLKVYPSPEMQLNWLSPPRDNKLR